MRATSLKDPIRIGPRTAPSRVVSLPHGQLSLGAQRLSDYFDLITRHGVGTVVLGGSVVSPESHGHLLNSLFDEASLDEIAPAIDAVHSNGALFVSQLLHIGAQTASMRGDYQPVFGPSAVPTTAEAPTALGRADIVRIRGEFAAAARAMAAREADGFELHAAHNYLLHQFLSPGQNLRADEYGGDLAGRARLLTEIATDIRAEFPDRVLGVRLAFGQAGRYGQSLEETLELCERLDRDQLIDYVTVSVPSFPHLYVRDESFPEADLRTVARLVKRTVAAVVNLTQRVASPALASECIASGDTDMVGVARELLADPRWASRTDAPGHELRPCLYCMQGCRPASFGPVTCDVNPTALASPAPAWSGTAPDHARTVVVGGGPAGCEAALAIAATGRPVVLIEERERIGGMVRIAGAAPHRDAWRRYADYLERRVLAAPGVETRLATRATAELIAAQGPGLVVLALGAVPVAPALQGVPVVSSYDFVAQPDAARGRRVLVLDDGGRWDAVNCVEMAVATGATHVRYATSRERVGDRVPEQSRWSMRRRLNGLGVALEVNHDRRSWDADAGSGPPAPGLADVGLVVWAGALHSTPLDGEEHLPMRVVRIGDALSPRGVAAATREGQGFGSLPASAPVAVGRATRRDS